MGGKRNRKNKKSKVEEKKEEVEEIVEVKRTSLGSELVREEGKAEEGKEENLVEIAPIQVFLGETGVSGLSESLENEPSDLIFSEKILDSIQNPPDSADPVFNEPVIDSIRNLSDSNDPVLNEKNSTPIVSKSSSSVSLPNLDDSLKNKAPEPLLEKPEDPLTVPDVILHEEIEDPSLIQLVSLPEDHTLIPHPEETKAVLINSPSDPPAPEFKEDVPEFRENLNESKIDIPESKEDFLEPKEDFSECKEELHEKTISSLPGTKPTDFNSPPIDSTLETSPIENLSNKNRPTEELSITPPQIEHHSFKTHSIENPLFEDRKIDDYLPENPQIDHHLLTDHVADDPTTSDDLSSPYKSRPDIYTSLHSEEPYYKKFLSDKDSEGSSKPAVHECEFFIHYETKFGEKIILVGDTEELGAWDPAKGVTLQWNSNHIWSTRVLITKMPFEYKYVCESDEQTLWEKGKNRGFYENPERVYDSWQAI